MKLPDLAALKKITSIAVCKKIINVNLTYAKLKNMFMIRGKDYLLDFLSEKISSRNVRVTKNKKYLENIINYFSNVK